MKTVLTSVKKLALFLAGIVLTGHVASAQDPLRVCMAENNAPFSFQEKDDMQGLDVEIARNLAQKLGRALRIVPFESKLEGESTLAQEVNALLSSGVCEMATGYPLTLPDLGAPSRPSARVPDFPGAPRPAKRPWITLRKLIAGPAYQAMTLALVVADSKFKNLSLADPGTARFGAVAGTLGGAVLMLYKGGKLKSQLQTLSQNDSPLQGISEGRLDAALIPLGQFDAWKLAHPATPLIRTDFLFPMHVNLGIVASAGSEELLDHASQVLRNAIDEGDLEKWARSSGTTWIAPSTPEVSPGITMAGLMVQ